MVLVDPGAGDEMPEVVVDPELASWTAYVGDIGGLVQVSVSNELGPETDGIPVHAHDAHVAQHEFLLFKVVAGSPGSQLQTLSLRPPCQCARELLVV